MSRSKPALLAFDRMVEEDDVRTMMGISPEQAAEFMVEHGCDVAALNCGNRCTSRGVRPDLEGRTWSALAGPARCRRQSVCTLARGSDPQI